MHDPGNRGETEIKQLLVSASGKARGVGLRQLDEAFRAPVMGAVRSWSSRFGPSVAAQELAEIWQETLTALARSVENGQFRRDGRLFAYLCKIARCRAIDRWRRRNLPTSGLDGATAKGPGALNELLEELETCYAKLPEKLAIAVRMDVRLYVQAGERWATLTELTRAINREYELSLSEATIKSRRWRARAELRRLLAQRGYDVRREAEL